ncbi:alpha-L-rhamnosidase N-terminal domain-containing protein, partial [Paenibacillus sepulcri]|nr:alpha-L-rhamnosidase N-terminal domain-containing protein [Paenibacillus sepulcri]
MTMVTKLRCEYRENPIGLDIRKPRISWQVQSDTRSWEQSAYQIQVSLEADLSAALWDSGKVQSDQSTHVALSELNVEAAQRYYYHIRVWDKQEQASPWSEIAYWETGLLEPAGWQADWVSAPLASFPPDSEQSPLLRRTFSVKAKVKSARIYATSLGIYEISLNGIRVGEDYFTPGWTSYNERLQYQTYEVTDLLAEGGNAVGAMLGNGWYKGNLGWVDHKNIYGDRTALLLQL